MRVLMWEARGDAVRLLAWLREAAIPALPPGVETELFRSADRVVALVRCPDALPMMPALPAPPPELVARPPHAWPFTTA
jgi:hypothetical protein